MSTPPKTSPATLVGTWHSSLLPEHVPTGLFAVTPGFLFLRIFDDPNSNRWYLHPMVLESVSESSIRLTAVKGAVTIHYDLEYLDIDTLVFSEINTVKKLSWLCTRLCPDKIPDWFTKRIEQYKSVGKTSGVSVHWR